MSRIKTMITKFIYYFNNKIENNHKANKRDIYKKHNPFIRIKNATTGITLVALVVTIVVLLILSGITIATLSGDNGVIQNSKEMANSVNSVQNDTEKELQDLTNQLGDVVEVTTDNINDWEYVVDSTTKTVTITKYRGKKEEIVIPNYIGGLPVKKVGSAISSEEYCPIWGTGVVIHVSSITTQKNDSIKRITISNGIEEIESCCFTNCDNLERVDIPDSIKKIGKFAFANCKKLTNIKIPSGVTSIGDYAFQNCTGLANVTIPSNVTTIGYQVFYNISSSAQIICDFMEKPNEWINGWTNCTNIVWLRKVEPKNIEDWEYTTDSTTNTITILRYKGKDTEVVIPNSIGGVKVTSLGGETGDQYSLWDKSICNSTTYGYGAYKQETITKVTISEGIETINYLGFVDSINLRNIIIPNTIKTISDGAFYNCTALTEITIPSGVIDMGYSIFSGCSSLHRVTIQDGVKRIPRWTFTGCIALTEITIPSSVITMGDNVFSGIPSITVTVPFKQGNKPSGWDSNWNSTSNGTVTVKYQ